MDELVSNTDELKPCPFCESKNIELVRIGNEHTKSRKVRIKCRKCRFARIDASLRHGHEWIENCAIAAWNSRPIEDELNKRITELEEENRLLSSAFHESETIHGDGSLSGSIVKMQRRIEELEQDNASLEVELKDHWLKEGLPPHDDPAECRTWLDGCNCTVGAMVDQVERIVEQSLRITELEEENAALKERIAHAATLINAAVDIMTPEQVGQWGGVRTWQEMDVADYLGLIEENAALKEERNELLERLSQTEYITDGHGNLWPKYCKCGGEMQVMRPGKAQCPECGGMEEE